MMPVIILLPLGTKYEIDVFHYLTLKSTGLICKQPLHHVLDNMLRMPNKGCTDATSSRFNNVIYITVSVKKKLPKC